MRSRDALRARIVAAYVLLACVVCSCFTVVAYVAIQQIENDVVDTRLKRAADQLIARYWQGLPQDLPLKVAMYHGENVPAPLRQLQPGLYELDHEALHVLVRDSRGVRFVLTDDESDFEHIVFEAYLALAAAFLACVGLAVLLGRVTASRVIAPITALARAVETGRDTHEFPSLRATDEVGVLARVLVERTEALQKLLARERWFVGDVSHELRTPLTIMLGAAEVLSARLRQHCDLLPVVERIRRTAADTTERVSALLLLSRSPESVGTPRTALLPVIRQEMERCQAYLEGKPVVLSLVTEQEVYVNARPELVGMAIGNLLRNACQFTDQGEVRVILEGARLLVEDSGAGVPIAIRDRLFERFVQSRPDPATGTGLGLAIVRRVADHLGWTISFEDRPGGGSRFILMMAHVS